MDEVVSMAVFKSLHELLHETLDGGLCELHHTRIQKTNQIVIAVFKHKIERP